MQTIGLSTLAFLAMLLWSAAPVLAAPTVFTVDTSAQRSSDGDLPENCTLGDALDAANADAARDACVHPNLGTGGPFEIVLPSGVGPFLLERSLRGTNGRVGLPVVRAAVTIHGNGNRIARHDTFACPDLVEDEFRLLEVAAGARLVIEDLSLEGGCAPSGGAVYNAGQLVLRRAIVADSVAFSDHGGGIHNKEGNAELVETTVRGNRSVRDGGGVYNAAGAVLVLRRSTVAQNDAVHGGGLENMSASATLLNSTVSSNNADEGGGISNSGGGGLTLVGSTIAGNGADRGPGLLNRNGGISIANSILADHCRFNRSPGRNDAGHNLARWNDCGISAPSSIAGQPTGLGPLQDNGGPTRTHALLAGSRAIDAGDAGTCQMAGIEDVDQRGQARPDGDPASAGACDMGAVERVDCDANGEDDGSEIAGDPALDGDGNGVLDACEDDPPVADAGADQVLECSSPAGADATLDGSASWDPEGQPLSHLWTGPFGTASGASPTVGVPLGSAAVQLEVTDPAGQTASDDLTVTVEDTTPPSAGAGVTRVASNGDWDDVQVAVSCSDVCDAAVAVEASFDGAAVADGDVVQVRGFTDASAAPRLTVRCTDLSGNVSEATAAAPAREPVVEPPPPEDRWSRWKKAIREHREAIREHREAIRERWKAVRERWISQRAKRHRLAGKLWRFVAARFR